MPKKWWKIMKKTMRKLDVFWIEILREIGCVRKVPNANKHIKTNGCLMISWFARFKNRFGNFKKTWKKGVEKAMQKTLENHQTSHPKSMPKPSNNHRKWGQNPSQNRCKIHTNFIFEKVMQKTPKIIQNGVPKGAKNHPKTYQKYVRKQGRKTVVRATSAGWTFCSGKGSFGALQKDNKRQTTRRKTTRSREDST